MEPAAAWDGLIVIGAGAAGLAAAQAARKLGARVLVLEARERVGGRVCTEVVEGVNVEMGAAFIHGVDGNPLCALAEDCGAATVAVRGAPRSAPP